MNKQRELYRLIRDSGLNTVTHEDMEDLWLKKHNHSISRPAIWRFAKRLQGQGVLEKTKACGVYRVKEPEDYE